MYMVFLIKHHIPENENEGHKKATDVFCKKKQPFARSEYEAAAQNTLEGGARVILRQSWLQHLFSLFKGKAPFTSKI
jgi:hypothetical protein